MRYNSKSKCINCITYTRSGCLDYWVMNRVCAFYYHRSKGSYWFAGDRSKVLKHKAWATIIVVPKYAGPKGSMTKNGQSGQMKPGCIQQCQEWTAQRAQSNAPKILFYPVSEQAWSSEDMSEEKQHSQKPTKNLWNSQSWTFAFHGQMTGTGLHTNLNSRPTCFKGFFSSKTTKQIVWSLNS